MDGRGDHGYGPYWEHAGHAGHGQPFLWLLFFLLFAALIGLVAAFVFRWLMNRQAGTVAMSPAVLGPAEDALGIVRMRYARGEIDREQFLQTTADLGGSAPAG